jgi:hypothetical protein
LLINLQNYEFNNFIIRIAWKTIARQAMEAAKAALPGLETSAKIPALEVLAKLTHKALLTKSPLPPLFFSKGGT